MATAGYSITKRKKKGKELGPWQLRVFVPGELQPSLGKKEIWRSLGTADRRAAERRAVDEVASIYREWKANEAASPMDSAAVAVKVGFDLMLADMEKRRRAWPSDDAEYEARLADRQATLRRFARELQDGDLARWERVADSVIATRRLSITKGSDDYTAFVQSIAEASIDAMGVFARRAAGELNAEPRMPVVREVKAKEAARAAPGETILELFESWAAAMQAKGEKRADTANQDRKVIQQFAAFVGQDRAIDSITPLEVAEYRDTLRDLPPKWNLNKQLRGLGMRSAATKARELNLARTAFTTVNKHLSTISPLYKWLRKHPRWAGLSNPCDGLFHDKVKGKNPRPPFSTDQLNRMLTSPLFTGFQAGGKEHLPGNCRADDWRYWIPVICLWTGARIGEIAQLRIGDIRQEHGYWIIYIAHDEDEGLSTKSKLSRPMAVHSKLIELGLLAFHARRAERAGGDERAQLFPEMEPNSRGQISGTPSRFWRDYLKRIGLKDGADGFGSHSFRHTIADQLRMADFLDEHIAIALGHKFKTVTAGYGKLTQGSVKMQSEMIERVQFEGVSFDHLIPS